MVRRGAAVDDFEEAVESVPKVVVNGAAEAGACALVALRCGGEIVRE